MTNELINVEHLEINDNFNMSDALNLSYKLVFGKKKRSIGQSGGNEDLVKIAIC